MNPNLQERLEVATRLARSAGEMARGFFARRAELPVEWKGPQDPVTKADRAVEHHLIAGLREAFPDDTFLAEESGGEVGEGTWAIDPIDGTANFVRGIPEFAVSLAFVHRGTLELGIIYQPTSKDLYRAHRGGGAQRNGEPLSVRRCSSLDTAIVGIGHSQRVPSRLVVETLGRLRERNAEVRILGSAALMLAQVAAGALDAYWEPHLHAWDALGGLLLVQEAGGHISDFLARDGLERGNSVLACTPGLRDALSTITGDRHRGYKRRESHGV